MAAEHLAEGRHVSTARRAVPALVGLISLVARPATALACGATPEPYYGVSGTSPTGDAVATNTPIIVALEEVADGPAHDAMSPRLTLIVRGSDESIAVRQAGAAPTLSWVPLQALAPETTYEAHYNPGYEGIPDTIWQFATGTQPAPALAIEGNLEVSFEPGMGPRYAFCNDCGTGCTELPPVRVTKARIRLPKVVGGFPRFWGSVWLTDDVPYDFSPFTKSSPQQYPHNVSGGAYTKLDGTEMQEVLLSVPREDTPYRPCFAFQASDARGDTVEAEPLCLMEPAPDTIGDSGPAVATRDASSCQFGHSASTGPAWLFGLFALALSRRSPRRTPAAQGRRVSSSFAR